MKIIANTLRKIETVVIEPGNPIHFPNVGNTNLRKTNPPTIVPNLRAVV